MRPVYTGVTGSRDCDTQYNGDDKKFMVAPAVAAAIGPPKQQHNLQWSRSTPYGHAL